MYESWRGVRIWKMRACCPPNRGCNTHGIEQPCVLTIFRAAEATIEEARVAVDRWEALESAEGREGAGAGERRFRRRAYERARDQALTAVAIDCVVEPPSGEPSVRRRRHLGSRSALAAGSHRGHASPVV